eukprot:6791722-Alexandrium_andersonii.AAC.1
MQRARTIPPKALETALRPLGRHRHCRGGGCARPDGGVSGGLSAPAETSAWAASCGQQGAKSKSR